MFKEENRVWLYLIGILIMFGIMGLSSQNILIPFIYRGERDVLPVFENEPRQFINTNLDYRAIIITNIGKISIDLFEKNSPKNVNNFTFLANESFYKGTKIHRVIPNLLFQGGDKNTLDNDNQNDGFGHPGYVVKDEINLESLNISKNRISELRNKGIKSDSNIISANLVKYTVAMANSGPDTNGSQFFIVTADSSDPRIKLMNGQFTVIGQVIDGFDTISRINQIQVDNSGSISKPTQEIILTDIQVFTV